MKRRPKYSAATRLFAVVCIVLWIFVISFAMYILKRDGDLRLRASEQFLAEGRVLDTNGRGVAGAELTIHKGDQNHFVITDSEGRFSTRHASEDNFTVTIDAKGYESAKSGISFAEGSKSYFIFTLAQL